MEYLIIVIVCLGASLIGAICGIGGGVIIKPVLDALGVMPVTTVSFLSGCTVLAMSFVSLYKRLREQQTFQFDKVIGTIIAVGAACGGLIGKEIYQQIIQRIQDTDSIGAVQAFILMLCTVGTLLYMKKKDKIVTKRISNKFVVFLVGFSLGMVSSFLGIGGGPINLVVLYFFFSMESKQAALYSIYIIMFSQMTSLISSIVNKTIPPLELPMLIVMIGCGVLGGILGSRVNRKIDSKQVDKLFVVLLFVIICISIYNIFRYI